jgi:hypothetical protein
MTGRNPDGAEDFPSEVAYGPQRLDTIIGAYEEFRDLWGSITRSDMAWAAFGG